MIVNWVNGVHINTPENLGLRRELSNVTIVNLVKPQSDDDDDKEQRKLEHDGENEDTSVSTAHCQGSSNLLEGLPAELLSASVNIERKQ